MRLSIQNHNLTGHYLSNQDKGLWNFRCIHHGGERYRYTRGIVSCPTFYQWNGASARAWGNWLRAKSVRKHWGSLRVVRVFWFQIEQGHEEKVAAGKKRKRSVRWKPAMLYGCADIYVWLTASMCEQTSKACWILYLVMSMPLMPTISSPECVSRSLVARRITRDLAYLFGMYELSRLS